MGAELSSKVIIEEEEPSIRSIDSVQTSVVAAVGVTERGPINEPTLVTSEPEFQKVFGGFTTDSDLALAVRGYFENGGQYLYVVRVVHYTDVANAATKTSDIGTLDLNTAVAAPSAGYSQAATIGPYDLEPGDTLSVAIDGGGPSVATFNATAGSRTAVNAGPYALVNGQTLLVSVDGGAAQTITFLTAEFVSIGAATATEVVAVINAKITGALATKPGAVPVITSDRRGTGSSIQVTGGTAAAAFAFPGAVGSGTGNVSNINAVTVAEVETVVEAAVAGCAVTNVGGAARITSNTTGGSSSVQVVAASTADDELGFDNAVHSGSTGAAGATLRVDGKTDGAYANALSIQISNATNGDANAFDLKILDDGLIVGNFPNLSMDDNADRYVEDVVNAESGGSSLIVVTDLDSSAASQRPANGTFGPMTGGDDGLASLADTDFIGSEAGATGLHALDTVANAQLLIVPGQTTAAVHNAMVDYCENFRDMSMFPILTSPEGLSAVAVNTYVVTTAGLKGLSEFGAFYWPRLKVLNPTTAVFGSATQITVDPCGIIAGRYAKTDAARRGGVYDAPAGVEEGALVGVVGFETEEVFDERKRDLVYPNRINILTKFDGAPAHIDGARCLKSDGNFPYVPQRRGAIFIEQSIKAGTQFARHKNNTAKLRRTVERSCRAFLIDQMKVEAFASMDPDKAFFVDFSDKLNNAAQVALGRMLGRIGLAFNTPAEFLTIRFSRDTREIDLAIEG
jgi:phage tail sheath protein FI